MCVCQCLILQWSLHFYNTLSPLLNINTLFCLLFVCFVFFCILSPNSSKMIPAFLFGKYQVTVSDNVIGCSVFVLRISSLDYRGDIIMYGKIASVIF